MKIGIYTSAIGDYISGGILCIVETLNHLQRRGHEVMAFVDQKPYRSTWIPAGFPILGTDTKEFKNFDGILVSPFSPTAAVTATHENAADRFYWVHTNEALFCHNGKPWQQMAKNSYSLPLKIFCTSTYVQILMEQQYNRYVIGELVPPGVDLDVFTPPEKPHNRSELVVAVLSRGGYVRGVDDAVTALKLAKSNSRIMMIPEGTNNRIAMASYFKEADVFIDSSRLAGSPTPVKEAMACGAIPICTHFGTTDFVLHGYNGYVVSPDNPVEIAHYISRIHGMNDSLREEMSHDAAYTMQDFSWSKIAERFEHAIEEGTRRGDQLLQKRDWEKNR